MDIFRNISTKISDIFKTNKSIDPVNKNDILDLIDNNLITLRLVVSMYEADSTLFDYIGREVMMSGGTHTDLKTQYDLYLKLLTNTGKQKEYVKFLSSVYAAAKLVLADHELMRSNFDGLFKDGTDEGEITIDQLKLSHAAVFGFINLSSLLADWFCFFVGQFDGRPKESLRIPAYRLNVVKDSSGTVASFVSDVLTRGPSRNIMYLIQTVRNTGDVSIYHDAATLDSYVNINDYPNIKGLMNPFAVFQPILYVREKLGMLSRYRYKRNIAMRDWVQAKLVILQMDADKMDQNSQEYLKQKQIVQRYSDELAKLDMLIDRYEQG